MSAISKLSIDAAAMFISRSRSPSPEQRQKHLDVTRSRSHGSSPIPIIRNQRHLAKSMAKENNLLDNNDTVSRNPFFARSSRYAQDSTVTKPENESAMINGSKALEIEYKQRKTSKCENGAGEGSEKRKKNSVVKNFLVNRLRSGSWHASSSSDDFKAPKGVRKVSEGSSREHFNGDSSKAENSDNSGNSRIDKELTGLVDHVLETHLRNEKFDRGQASEKCCLLSKVLEKAVKSRLNTSGNNFKISVLVYMGEIKDDGIKMATQCAWEPSQDHFAMATYESDKLFVSAMVFAVEFDNGYDAGS